MKKLAVIILAAGQGTRMRSKVAKVLHSVGGRPMLLYAVDVAQAFGEFEIARALQSTGKGRDDLLARQPRAARPAHGLTASAA